MGEIASKAQNKPSKDLTEQVLLQTVEIDRLSEVVSDMTKERNKLIIANDELIIVQQQYDDLLQATKASDSEKDQMVAKTIDKLKEIEIDICGYQRKIEFLKAENDNVNNNLRAIKLDHLKILHELRKEIANKNGLIKKLESKNTKREDSTIDREKIGQLEADVEKMKLETNNFYTIFLKNIQEVDKSHLIDIDYRKLANFSLIKNDLTIEFITKNEFERLNENIRKLQEEVERLTLKNFHMEELLKISQNQVMSQQQIISKFSEEEISLRHLVADLQSSSNEKYLLAKTQKELDRCEFIRLALVRVYDIDYDFLNFQ